MADADVGTGAGIYSDTRVVSMLDRRKQLKRQRRNQFWKKTWRTTAILGLTLGLGWLFNKPGWQIKQASQIEISGNSQLSTQTLETFLPLTFPTSLLRVRPTDIKTMLEQNTHADQVLVYRQLFPPRIIVRIQERPPVALITCPNCLLASQNVASAQPITIGPADQWLVDDRGIALPSSSYPKLEQTRKASDLVLNGYLKPLDAKRVKAIAFKNAPGQPAPTFVALDANTQKEWQALYLPLRSSPVKIQQVNWQKNDRLSLKTELGLVQVGPFSARFSEQLKALDQMRALPQTVDAKNIKFINLENPKNPVVELNTVPPAPKLQENP
jgi:cell division protein FtsQ